MSAVPPLPAEVAQVEPAETLPPRWARLLLTRERGTALALFRMAIGVCLLGSLGSVVAHGDVAALWLDPAHGGLITPHVGRLFRLLGGTGPAQLWSVLGATALVALLLVAGLGGRLPAVLALVGHEAITQLNADAGGSYDPLLSNALWLLVLAQSTATLSLDCRLRTGRWTSAKYVPAWPRWLALYQLVLMYFATGIQKVSDTWVPGGEFSALYYILQQPTWQRFDMRWVAWLFPLTQLFTAATWFFEVGSPLLLVAIYLERQGRGRIGRWLQRVPFRRVYAGVGLALHLGTALLMELGVFPYLAMAFYLALLAPPHGSEAREADVG